MRWPDIHGDQVVFTAEGDLWLASIATGVAQRLTSHPGIEIRARFSPDGTQIAFNGQYDGASEAYVMPSLGGAPLRLTYDANRVGVLGWTPDGKRVLYKSARRNGVGTEKLYAVDARGGAPTELPIPQVEQAEMNADGRRIAYVPVSADWQHWYRYRGGEADHLYLTDITTHTFRRLGDFDGIDKDPVWVGDRLYFISQRDGVPNLYRMNPANGKATQVTHYRVEAYPGAYPSDTTAASARKLSYTDYEIDHLSSDGKRLIYEHGAGLAVYDPASDQTRELRFALPSDRIHARQRRVAIAPYVNAAALGPTGKRLIVEARGQLLSVPVGEGESRPVASQPGSRAHGAVWSPDGTRAAFVSDRSGEEEVWIAPATGLDAPRQLTHRANHGPLNHLEWSPDGAWLAVGDREMRILLIDAHSGAIALVDQSHRGASYDSGNDDYTFSPDGKWLAYSRLEENWNSAVYLYEIAGKKRVPISNPEMNASSPAFDNEGKYLVYLADRQFDPKSSGPSHYFAFDRTTRVTLVTLAKTTHSPYLVANDEEGASPPDANAPDANAKDEKDAHDTKEAKDTGGAKSAPEETKPEASAKPKTGKSPLPALPKMVVDVDGLENRVIDVPVDAGNYEKAEIVGDRLLLLDGRDRFAPVPGSGPGGGRLLALRLKKPTPGLPADAVGPKTVAEHVEDFDLSADNKKLLIASNGGFSVVDADAETVSPSAVVDLHTQTIDVDPPAEWRQIFNESWRIARDFYYDPNMGGLDWPAVRAKYAALLPSVADRSDLNLLLGDMIAELNTGHAYVGGGDLGGPTRTVPLGYLGADLSPVPGAAPKPNTPAGSEAYRIDRIYAGDGFDLSARSPLLEPGVDVHVGDYLFAIGGQPVRVDQDVEALLVGTPGQIVTLTVNDKPTAMGARTVLVRPHDIGAERNLRYYAWAGDRRAYVAEHGGANLGYVDIPDMENRGLTEFAKHYYANLNKDGIVYDVRYNGGGYIDAMLLLQMGSKPYSYFQPRYGISWTRQDWAFAGYSAALCNENSGSDAEEFSDAFQRLHIGPVIGARSWGGEVGSGGGYRLIDGGTINIPNYGEWTPDKKWVIEGTGVHPDYPVEQDPAAVLAGQDPQLDRAIAYLKNQIAKHPVVHPEHPPFPNKALALPTDAAAPPGSAAPEGEKSGGGPTGGNR